MSIRWAVTQQRRISVASDWSKGWPCNSTQPLSDQLHGEIEGEEPQSRVQRARKHRKAEMRVRARRVLSTYFSSPKSQEPLLSHLFISMLLQNPQVSHLGGMRSATYSQMALQLLPSLSIIILHLFISSSSFGQSLGSLKGILF